MIFEGFTKVRPADPEQAGSWTADPGLYHWDRPDLYPVWERSSLVRADLSGRRPDPRPLDPICSLSD